MCDCDLPQTQQTTMRRARVLHKCCECGGPIAPGTTYEYVSGIWDHRPADFKTCAECAAIRAWYVAECLPSGECWPCFGDLIQDATNYGNEGSHAALVTAATAAGYL